MKDGKTGLPAHPLIDKASALISFASNRADIVETAKILCADCPGITPDAVAGHMVSFVADALKMDAADIARELSPRAAEICVGVQKVQMELDGKVHLHPDADVRSSFLAIAAFDIEDDLRCYKNKNINDPVTLPSEIPGMTDTASVGEILQASFLFFGQNVLPAANMPSCPPALRERVKDAMNALYKRLEEEPAAAPKKPSGKKPALN